MRVHSAALLVTSAALGLTACNPPHPHAHASEPLKTISSLRCPESEGDLKLQGAASRSSCVYADDQGSQVKLLLVSLTNGETTDAALQPFQHAAEAQQPGLAASAAAGATATAGGATVSTGGVNISSDSDHDKADIDLPGIHIHSNGDNANVDVAGVHVHSDDAGNHKATITTHVNNDKVLINAEEGGARIHIDENGDGVRTTFILAGKNPGPNGWRVAGYEARGPVGGPLAVATMLGKSDSHDELHRDIRALLTDNVGN